MLIESSENQQLEALMAANQDACIYYETAREHIDHPQLGLTFANLQALHNSVIANIEDQIRKNGGVAKPESTLMNRAEKLWTEIRDEKQQGTDMNAHFISYLEQVEQRCLDMMKTMIDAPELRQETKIALEDNLMALEKSYDYIKALKETLHYA